MDHSRLKSTAVRAWCASRRPRRPQKAFARGSNLAARSVSISVRRSDNSSASPNWDAQPLVRSATRRAARMQQLLRPILGNGEAAATLGETYEAVTLVRIGLPLICSQTRSWRSTACTRVGRWSRSRPSTGCGLGESVAEPCIGPPASSDATTKPSSSWSTCPSPTCGAVFGEACSRSSSCTRSRATSSTAAGGRSTHASSDPEEQLQLPAPQRRLHHLLAGQGDVRCPPTR